MAKPKTREVTTIVGEGQFGQLYNFMFKFEEKFYNLFSFQMTKDGSLIIFQRGNASTKSWSGILNASRIGTRTLKFKDFEERSIDKTDNAGKVTFHTSGIINTSGGRSVRDSLRTMDVTQPLATIVHRHLNHMLPVSLKESNKNKNFYLTFDERPEYHVQSRIFLSPLRNNIFNSYVQDSTIVAFSVQFTADSIEHSDKTLFAQVLIEVGPTAPKGQESDKDIMLMIQLPDHTLPSHLKPKK